MTTTGRAPEQPEQPQTPTDSRPDTDRSAPAVARIQGAQLITATSPADPAEVRLRAHLSRVHPGPVWVDEIVLFDFLGDVLMALGRQIAESLAQAGKAAAELNQRDLLAEQPPADPRARALWLRQHRNTGPTRRQRAPRHLDARRSTR